MASSEFTQPPAAWEQVKDLLLAAQEENPEDLQAWLEARCPDLWVRSEVQRLMQAAASAGGFLEGSASESQLGIRPPHPARIGRYRIIDELGSGGLGVVYSAMDELLDRPVALKVLRNPENTSREIRERLYWDARTACALSHPNIVTVHDIGADEGLDYIVMELIEGQTLHRAVPPGGMDQARAVRIALQIVAGLEAAHNAHIIHRDLKPGNIMLAGGDNVKLLDFGLAKPMLQLDEEPGHPATIEGRFAGTAAYVSPEQAEGKPVDERGDIFSFGCILYEMLTGHQAFEGRSALSVILRIMQHEAPRITSLNTGLDARLDDIVYRCLRKQPDDRYQTVADLKQDLAQCAVPIRTVLPRISWRRTNWFAWSVIGAVLVTACVATWMATSFLARPQPEPPFLLTRLTSGGGLTQDPAISPDGKYVAFASDRGGHGNLDVFVQDISGGDPHPLAEGPANESEPVFSPDGTQIVFRSDAEGGGLYTVSTLGSKPRLLAAGGRGPRFSPDGKWLAFWTGAMGGAALTGSAQAMVIPAAGGTEQPVSPSLEFSATPVWDPTGQKILCLGRSKNDKIKWWLIDFRTHSGKPTDLMRVDVGNRMLREPAGKYSITPLCWMADQTVLFAAKLGDATNIWGRKISSEGRPLDAPRRWTAGTDIEMNASATITNNEVRVVYDAVRLSPGIRKVNLTSSGVSGSEPRPLLEGFAGLSSPSLDATGSKLAFMIREPNSQFIKTMDVATGQVDSVATITSSRSVFPHLSGDGKWIAYFTNGSSFLLPAKGGAHTQLCTHCGPPTDLGSDASQILFESGSLTNQFLLGSRGANPVPFLRVVDAPGLNMSAGRWSPDRHWVVFCASENRKRAIYVAPVLPDGTVTRAQLIPLSQPGAEAWEPVWSPDGKHIYFVARSDGFVCVWGREIDPRSGQPSGAPFAVAHYHKAREVIRGDSAHTEDVGLSAAPGFLVYGVTQLDGATWLRTGPHQN